MLFTKNRLSKEMFDLLLDVIQRREPRLLGLPFFSQERGLTDEEREDLREVLADELCEVGLKANDEPNKYGLLIDDLIGKLMNF